MSVILMLSGHLMKTTGPMEVVSLLPLQIREPLIIQLQQV